MLTTEVTNGTCQPARVTSTCCTKTLVATAAAVIRLMAQYHRSVYRDQCSRVLAQLLQVKHTHAISDKAVARSGLTDPSALAISVKSITSVA